MAVLAHVLQLVGGTIAPLVIFFIRRQSRFVTFHALQVLLFESICLFLTMFVTAGVFLAVAFGMSFGSSFSQHSKAAAPEVFFFSLGCSG